MRHPNRAIAAPLMLLRLYIQSFIHWGSFLPMTPEVYDYRAVRYMEAVNKAHVKCVEIMTLED